MIKWIILVGVIFIIFFIIYIKSIMNYMLNKIVFHPPIIYNINNKPFFIKSKNGNKIAYYMYSNGKIITNETSKDTLNTSNTNDTLNTSHPNDTNDAPNTITENSKNIIIYSHGNACSASNFNYAINRLSIELNTDILIYDYQGYGFSEGKCNEKNCYEDLESIIDHVKYHTNYDNIYLIGRSLGTGIVIDYVSKNPWYTPVLLISPYKSIISVVDNVKVMKYFTNFMSTYFDLFTTISKINKVKCPMLIIHGYNDRLINCKHSLVLQQHIKHKKSVVYINNSDHKNIMDETDIQIFKDFVNFNINYNGNNILYVS